MPACMYKYIVWSKRHSYLFKKFYYYFSMKNILFAAIAAIFLLASCKKDDTSLYNKNVKANLSVEFDNIAGSSDLQLNTGIYTNSSGENFTISKLKYYVSNFVLTNSDGTVYTVPQDSCYFLIDESDEETHEPLLQVPEGEYRTLQFTLGVDSLRSTMSMDKRTGVLNPATNSDMYWDANAGYIFFNIEGSSGASSTNNFTYHIGGFGGSSASAINNIKTISLDLTQRGVPQVKTGRTANIHLMADVLKLFNGVSTVSIAAHPVIGLEDYSAVVANNIASMFRHDHTENE